MSLDEECIDSTLCDCSDCRGQPPEYKCPAKSVRTVNVTVYGARGAVHQHRRVTVLAASDDDAMAKALRICTNNVPYINLDSELADVEVSKLDGKPLAPVATPHRTPSYRQA